MTADTAPRTHEPQTYKGVRFRIGSGPQQTVELSNKQLQRLESLPIPLAVSDKDPTHTQRLLWTFPHLSESGEQEILQRLSALGAPYAPKPREEMELRHSWERTQSHQALSLRSYPWIYEHEIGPNSVRDPESGCVVFMGPRNRTGYGMPVPNRPRIGATPSHGWSTVALYGLAPKYTTSAEREHAWIQTIWKPCLLRSTE